jgi:hypothetical protein
MTIDITDLPDLATPVATQGAIRSGEIAGDDLFDYTVSIVLLTTGGA